MAQGEGPEFKLSVSKTKQNRKKWLNFLDARKKI
jgi:hypothetical protein